MSGEKSGVNGKNQRYSRHFVLPLIASTNRIVERVSIVHLMRYGGDYTLQDNNKNKTKLRVFQISYHEGLTTYDIPNDRPFRLEMYSTNDSDLSPLEGNEYLIENGSSTTKSAQY